MPRKSIKMPERSDVRRPTSDDWYPTAKDGTVEVTFAELTTGQWRVCVWGDDDCGMERDFPPHDRDPALRMYELLAGCSDVTKRLCADLGMTFA